MSSTDPTLPIGTIEAPDPQDVLVYGSDNPHDEGAKTRARSSSENLALLGPAVIERFVVTNAELLTPWRWHENGPQELSPGAVSFSSGDSVVFQDIGMGCLKTSE
ncbi:hypothetical protein M1248_09260 [Mycobacterium sp. 29Ha]|nr:hypothetical protein [Mycobacterium sp. 29Ha]